MWVALIISVVMLLAGSIAGGGKSQEKGTAFECGFESSASLRSTLSSTYLLFLILFLIWDVELCLLFPLLSHYSSATYTFFLLVVGILIVGLLHEMHEGALSWAHVQL